MNTEGTVVVIATDGSEHSRHALKKYVTDYHKPGNRVVLVYVAQYHDISYGGVALIPGDPALVERIVQAEEERCSEVIKKLELDLEQLQIDGKVVRVNGEPGHEILHKAKELKATYIVTGARGMGQVRRTILGGVSDYLVHHAHIPVVVCKMDEGPSHRNQKH